jgi:hypothetical protein
MVVEVEVPEVVVPETLAVVTETVPAFKVPPA